MNICQPHEDKSFQFTSGINLFAFAQLGIVFHHRNCIFVQVQRKITINCIFRWFLLNPRWADTLACYSHYGYAAISVSVCVSGCYKYRYRLTCKITASHSTIQKIPTKQNNCIYAYVFWFCVYFWIVEYGAVISRGYTDYGIDTCNRNNGAFTVWITVVLKH